MESDEERRVARRSRPAVITERRQITASWLTEALCAGRHLRQGEGEVATLSVKRWRGKALSDLYRLQATYNGTAAVPASFILKVGRADVRSAVAGRRRWKEHEFYTRVAPVMDVPPIPRLFAAAYHRATQRSHLLLEDLTVSHGGTPAPLPPTPEQLEGEVDCLARIHAWWWGDPDLDAAVAERDDAWVNARAASARRRLTRFLDAFGAHIPRSMRSALETVAAAWPAILRRTTAMPLTIVHGDAHPWNFLWPLNPEGRTCLLDWEGWSIEPGPHDLASLLALHLPVSERRAQEGALIDRYVARLQEHGVSGYGQAACWDDYRWAVARRVLSPAGLWSRGAQTRSWWPALEHITAAYHDLDCEKVL